MTPKSALASPHFRKNNTPIPRSEQFRHPTLAVWIYKTPSYAQHLFASVLWDLPLLIATTKKLSTVPKAKPTRLRFFSSPFQVILKIPTNFIVAWEIRDRLKDLFSPDLFTQPWSLKGIGRIHSFAVLPHNRRLYTGLPFSGSHRMSFHADLDAYGAIACASIPVYPWERIDQTAKDRHDQISSGSCSTQNRHPEKICGNSCWDWPTTVPFSSNKISSRTGSYLIR